MSHFHFACVIPRIPISAAYRSPRLVTRSSTDQPPTCGCDIGLTGCCRVSETGPVGDGQTCTEGRRTKLGKEARPTNNIAMKLRLPGLVASFRCLRFLLL